MQYCLVNWLLLRIGEKLREPVEERLSFSETGEIPQRNLEVMVQAEEVAAEIIRKPEKEEKKRLKKEKIENGRLPLLLHLQKTAVVAQRSMWRDVKDPERRKSQSSRRLVRRTEWKTHLSL
uniref:Uncharacterized protein n=1 Tax=Rousettus aegyptiacus TaxID=9407 RepID=A0A7J8GB59_ROUAE|nr:hypothetical protein HJG63_011709 [Rousettus aegyptiacus]